MSFFLRRILSVIPTLFICSALVFVAVQVIPGDPVDHFMGERGADPELRKELKARWGFDRPWYEQYAIFIVRGLQGDLGRSLISGQPVWKEFMARFPATVELSFFALLFALLLGIPMGFLSALKVNSFWDMVCSGVSLTGYSLSVFWWGLILILLFSIYLGLTPVSGRVNVLYEIQPVTGFMLVDAWFSESGSLAFKSAFKHLILPVLTLGTIPLAYITRMTRISLLEIFKEDFIRTAKAKGVCSYQVYSAHVLKNALIPIITATGLMAGALLTGAVLTETVFSWPGVGRWLVQAVLARDYPVLRGGVLLMAVIITLINLFVDALYPIVDPRIRSLSKRV